MLVFSLSLTQFAAAETTTNEASRWVNALAWPASDKVARMSFNEERFFPFRKFPKRFSGELFRAPNGELAFCYTEPQALKLLLLADGIYLVEDGEVRKLPNDSNSVRILQEMFSSDKAALAANWQAEASGDTFRLRPKDDALAKSVKYIDLKTNNGHVTEVSLHLKDGVVRDYTFSEISHDTAEAFGDPFAKP